MKYRDFSEMPDDALRAFANALAAAGRKKPKRRGLVHDPLASPKKPIGSRPTSQLPSQSRGAEAK